MNYLLAALGTYRISRMVVLEEGPFSVFSKLQDATRKQDTWIERGLNCPLCLSWWISILPAMLIAKKDKKSFLEFLLIWFGIAGGAVVFYNRVH